MPPQLVPASPPQPQIPPEMTLTLILEGLLIILVSMKMADSFVMALLSVSVQ